MAALGVILSFYLYFAWLRCITTTEGTWWAVHVCQWSVLGEAGCTGMSIARPVLCISSHHIHCSPEALPGLRAVGQPTHSTQSSGGEILRGQDSTKCLVVCVQFSCHLGLVQRTSVCWLQNLYTHPDINNFACSLRSLLQLISTCSCV